MNDAEFRESLREIGPLLPVLTCGGTVIDGRRRAKLCGEVGQTPRIVELEPLQATRALWLLHPERALERAGKQSLIDYAFLFGTRPLHVAQYLARTRAETPMIEVEQLTGTTLCDRHVQMWWPAKLHHLADLAARQRGQNVSALVREAVATHVARVLGSEELQRLGAMHDNRARPRRSRTVAGVVHRPAQATPDRRVTRKRA